MEKVKIIKEGYRCQRCGHEWIPKSDEVPIVCPNCKSPYWNKSRKENERTKE